MKSKKELIRVVRISDSSSDNSFELDFTGKKSGRGAYLCPSLDCFDKAHKKKGLERSFGQAVPSEVYQKLSKELSNGEP